MTGSTSTFVLALAGLAGLVLLPASVSSCAPRARMCALSTDCAAAAACVAGRCQPEQKGVKPAIDAARRVVARPVDLAYLRRGEAAPGAEALGEGGGALPPQFVLGREPAILLLRFSAPVAPSTNIVEAYLVLRRSTLVDPDPTPISLHATRIVQAWNGRSTSWALQPRTVEAKLPSTTVDPAGPLLVRLDVRDLVRNWAKHDPQDHGLAVTAENDSRTGMAFALRAAGGERSPSRLDGDGVLAIPTAGLSGGSAREVDARSSSAPDVEPYLELYVR